MSAQQVVLTTVEPGGPARRRFPLTVGLPFAPGVLPPGMPIAVRDAAGQAVPIQSRVMETHGDGSARWLLVDYQADLPALAAASHVLNLGDHSPEVPAETLIRTQEQGSRLFVETGDLKIELDRQACQPLARVWHKGELVSSGGLDVSITGGDHKTYATAAGKAVNFRIEENGLLRFVAAWEGAHQGTRGRKHFDFLVRLTVYGGQSFVKLDHVFFNRLEPAETKVRQLTARLPLKLKGKLRYHAGGRHRPGPPTPGPAVYAGDKPLRTEQLKLNHHRATSGARLVKEDSRHMAGFVNVSSSTQGALLAGKWFWQNYPKAVEAQRNALIADLIPRQRKPFVVPRGMAKQHTFFFAFHGGLSDDRQVSDLAYQLQRWPMPCASAEYYQQSGQVWDYFPYYPQQYQRLEAAFRQFYPPDRAERTEAGFGKRAYGLKHYGDWVITYDSHGWQGARQPAAFDPDAPDVYYINNEYDTAHVLAMLFLRQPDIIRWWGVEAHALHTMDVDTAHYIPAKETNRDASLMAGCQYRHCFQHIGSIQSLTEPHTGAGLSHAFADGVFAYYRLSGDARARQQVLDTARQLAEFTLHPKGFVWGLGRSLGWGMLIMGAAHMIQPDERVIEAANAMLDKVLIEEMRDGGQVMKGAFHPNEWSDRGISLGVRGMIRWHQATGCDKTRHLFLTLMNQFVNLCIGPEGLPIASNWPENGKPTTASQGFANLEGLAYAFDLTGDRRFLDAGLGAMVHAVQWILDPDSDPASRAAPSSSCAACAARCASSPWLTSTASCSGCRRRASGRRDPRAPPGRKGFFEICRPRGLDSHPPPGVINVFNVVVVVRGRAK